ncbi:MAG: hypothetical protein BMS9Abin04_104 [Planctomycetia bacterium]|nr:MAG: hypothetical protein BMS9Abin04_104 [Planctomycetia bacterium]
MRQDLRRQPYRAQAMAAGVVLAVFLVRAGCAEAANEPVVFGRDIRPILSGRCFACHGPDREGQENELRFDQRQSALEVDAIVPGKAAASSLVERVVSEDPDEQMPPPDSHKGRLTAAEVDLLRRWIDQGAAYAEHWAYATLERPPVPAVPAVADAAWPAGAIDCFIAAEWQRHGMQPGREADHRTLARRLSLDLLGLPPTPEEVAAFTSDTTAGAYQRRVDKLLASPHFGERMAIYWLDLVRFADSSGYHGDQYRDLSAYRDYVIDAWNSNKPFDQFTIEQLAGDLLPAAGNEQKIASGYNRLLQTTEEGGAQRQEYLAIYAADRVRNVSSVWLGSTLGCCQCHDHKFDPFPTRDFYSLAAFFADLREVVPGRQPANLKLPTAAEAAEMEDLGRRLAEAERAVVPAAAQAKWEEEMRAKIAARQEDSPNVGPDAPGAAAADVAAAGLDLPAAVAAALQVDMQQRSAEQTTALAAYYRGVAPELEPLRRQVAAWKKRLAELEESIQTMLVSESTEPRTVRILPRGNWQDDSGPVVTPNTPRSLPPLHVSGRRPNRLDLARWMVAPENPLVARVLVNRLWYLMFGNGLARSLDDVGYQGQWPSHPRLLDWLAVELIESGWDVKHMIKLIVMSRTYRQTAATAAEDRERDPDNQWLARQNSFRLDAELIRDNALAVSGLLVRDVGSRRSVKPYQPAGFWKNLNFPKRTYVCDQGAGQYRRGVYTYWCRTFTHPSLATFDAPSREECTAQRPRSNTPLQALVLLNDPTYVEAARVFAQRFLLPPAGGFSERIGVAYQQILSRDPTVEESRILARVYQQQRRRYAADAEAAGALVDVGQTPVPDGTNVPELAAWTSVARVMLNLGETVTRN